MVNWKSKKLGDALLLGNGIVLMVLVNLLASLFFFRIDLTDEKRFSIKPQTKEMLKNLEDKVYVEVYLEGDLNAGFTRFRKSIQETLEEFRIYSDNKVSYTFIDPAGALSQKAQREFMEELAVKGIQPTNVIENQNGQRIEKLIFPGAILSYEGLETGVMLLKGNKGGSPEQEINQSIEGIEFEFANAIHKLSSTERKQIGFVKGHGELDSLHAAGLYAAMEEVYEPTDITLRGSHLADFDALIIAKPTKRFSEEDKYAFDQYIMGGGKALIMMDRLEVSMDSASLPNYFAFPYNTDLDDLLFKYGVRLNMDLIRDNNAGFFPVVTGQAGSTPRIQLMEWPFFPLVNQYADHPVTRNLDAVEFRFVSSMDTVKAVGIKKTPLAFSSQYAKTLTAPVQVNINQFRNNAQEEYPKSFIPVAYLLEGKFSSLYKNRFLPSGSSNFQAEGVPSKVIIISDGDIAASQVNPRTGQPQALGFNAVTNYTYGNRDFIMNMLAYLTDENGLITARNKEVKIRPLDKQRVQNEKVKWQFINLVIPVLVLVAYGSVRVVLRKRKYSQFT